MKDTEKPSGHALKLLLNTDWTDVGKTPGTANIDGIAIDASSDVPLTSEK